MYEKLLNQARRDLKHAELSFKLEEYEWCCYACSQAVYHALKALLVHYGIEAISKQPIVLARILEKEGKSLPELTKAVKKVEEIYSLIKYPDWSLEAPYEILSEKEVKECIQNTRKILNYVEKLLKTDDDPREAK